MSQYKRKGKKSYGGSRPHLPNKLPLPHPTIEGFQQLGGLCENIGLLFDRYLRFTGSGKADWDMGKYDKNNTAKDWNLRQIVQAQSNLSRNWENMGYKAVIDRWLVMAKNQNILSFKMTPEWRFVVGLGDKTALEVGFTFHRIYGFPIIPGSSLKGLARAVALNEIAGLLKIPKLGLTEAKKRAKAKKEKRCQQEECDMPLDKLDNVLTAYDERIIGSKERKLAKEEEEKALEKLRSDVPQINIELYETEINQFRQIFGTQQAAGEAVFFDALPAAAPNLEIDVMNVHYKKYYGDDKENPTVPPSDDDDPTPIPFLTVGQTPFWFTVGWRGEIDQAGVKRARIWLETGLHDFGVGAKTAVGYGYFFQET